MYEQLFIDVLKWMFGGIIMNTTTQAFQNKTADNIHSCTPCFYKPFNTKELLFLQKKMREQQYNMYTACVTFVFFSFCQCSIYKGTQFHQLPPSERNMYCTALSLELSYYIFKVIDPRRPRF